MIGSPLSCSGTCQVIITLEDVISVIYSSSGGNIGRERGTRGLVREGVRGLVREGVRGG